MDIADVRHLAHLSRLALSDEECVAYAQDMNAILGYVGQIQEAASSDESMNGQAGSAFVTNVLRDDVVTHTPDQYTDAVVSLAPASDGRYVVVKKILSTGDES